MADNFRTKIAKARKEGFSDEEIRSYLKTSPQVTKALKEGLTEQDVWEHFGLGEVAKANAEGVSNFDKITTELGRGAKLVGGGLAKGAAASVGLVGDIANLSSKYIVPHMPEMLQPYIDTSNPYPTSASMIGRVNDLGLGGPAPEGTGEQYLSAAAQGVGSAVPLLLTGGGAGANLLAGGMGGMGAQAGLEMFPDSKLAPLVASWSSTCAKSPP